MIGYNIKYKGTFGDRHNLITDIVIMGKGYVGPVHNLLLSDTPLIISKPSGDKLTHIFGTGVEINVITKHILEYTDLFATAVDEHYVLITRNNIKLFEGFILPNLYEQTIKKNSVISLPANDQLSSLKEKTINIPPTEESFIKVIDLLKNIIWSTGLKIPIAVKNGLFNTTYTLAHNPNITPFDETYLDINKFISEEEPLDSYKMLEEILKTFGSRLYYLNGRWVIDRLKNHKNLNSYKIYNFDGTTSTEVINHPVIDIKAHNVLADSGHLSLLSGVKEYELELKTDLYNNLVNRSFLNILSSTGDIFTSTTPGFGSVNLIHPRRFFWLHNMPNTSFILNNNYSDINIQRGIEFKPISGGSVNPINQIISTKIIISNKPDISLSVRFKVSLENIPIVANRNYRIRYSIRYKAPNQPFKHKWLSLTDNVLSTESDIFWNFLKCVFQKSVSGEELLKNDSTLIEVSDTIRISDVVDIIKQDVSPNQPLKNIELYIDFYGISATPHPLNPFTTRIGDINIRSNENLENNLLKATIEANHNDIKKLDLNFYDSVYSNKKNTLYFLNINNYFPTGNSLWSEVGTTRKIDLQRIYLTDLIQNFALNRFKFNIDIIPKTTEVVDLHNLFKYVHINRGLNETEMICVGYEYNVKHNSFSLYLEEWVDDDGYFIIEGSPPPPPPQNILEVNPSYFLFDGNSFGDNASINCNTSWFASGGGGWVSFPTTGTGSGLFTISGEALPVGVQIRNTVININTISGDIIRHISILQTNEFMVAF